MKVAVTTLAFCAAALLALGLVMVYSASQALVNAHTHAEVGARMLQMQLVWCALGLLACAVTAVLDYGLLKKFAWPIFIGAMVLAACVFVPHFGMKINGAHRWIRLPGATFQPSELVKLALIIMLAWYCDRSQRKMGTFKRGIIFPGLIISAALGLVFIEPDRGTTILLAVVCCMMLLVAGVRLHHLFLPALGGAAVLAVSIFYDPMRMNRIAAWLHPQDHLNGAALQGQQAMIAIGSGGVTGLGLGNGLQKLGYVPEIQTDFIFANIGEELGLIATIFVVVAFLLIAVCGIYIALNARDNFGCVLASGITFLISLQAVINIGVVTSVLPNKGLALPFISSGGSNLLAMLACIGILFSIARHAPVRESTGKKKSESAAGQNDNPFAARAT
ncbi:MAG TPA: putative lipid II flippase FtsW [Verrucomicrobiae bacterium]|jgi:cell division protein FtsW|nr:putative lipid II flippase FtsW [Verrucomicrobiae bacterium]